MKSRYLSTLAITALFTAACQVDGTNAANNDAPNQPVQNALPFAVEPIADFDEPWAMTFLPDGKTALVTEKAGKLILLTIGGKQREVSGVPEVDYGGQGGLGDIILGPGFAEDGTVYLSWAEAGEGNTRGAAVGRATLDSSGPVPALQNLEIIWRQYPKVSGRGHYGHRLAFSPDGEYLFIASGERQKFDPAQDMASNMGKLVRLYPDGSIPEDNPFFVGADNVKSQIWSLGHRNPLGIAFDDNGNLWNQEMGPAGGDEVNLVQRGANYGYPAVSNGDHYDGTDIPDHSPGDGFTAPKAFWNPAISPAGLIYYSGTLFPQWTGSLFLGGLGAQNLVRLNVNGTELVKADAWPMNARIREVEQGPDGAIWLLEDGQRGSGGRLLKLTPAD